MGCSFGFFWSNRDFLALNTTNDSNRNYYYGLETFFYTMTFILVPLIIGAFLATADTNGWFGGNINIGYQDRDLHCFSTDDSFQYCHS